MASQRLLLPLALLALAGIGASAALSLPALAEPDPEKSGPEEMRIPAGVPGARELYERWEISYRYTRLGYTDNLDGTDTVSDEEILADGFESVATSRVAHAHRLGLGFVPIERIWLFAELPLITMEEHYTNQFGRSSADSSLVGDLSLRAMFQFMSKGEERLNVGLELIAPTGEFSQRGNISGTGRHDVLPYPMQLGSGSWAFAPIATYMGQNRRVSWGTSFRAVLPVNDNSHDYRLGNRFELTGWAGGRLADWLDVSLRLGWTYGENVRGADPRMDPSQIPSAGPNRQAGHRLDLGPGLNFGIPGLAGQRVAVEMLWPVYQNLDGPQLANDTTIHVAWHWGF